MKKNNKKIFKSFKTKAKKLKLKSKLFTQDKSKKKKPDKKAVADKFYDKVKKNAEGLTGIFTAHPRGFGFVTVEGYDEDFYISEENVRGAFNQDKVEIVPLSKSSGNRQEARVVEIIERGVSTLVGTYEKSKGFGFVVPDDKRFSKDIFVGKGQSNGAKNGQKVICKIIFYGAPDKKPEGRVLEILGDKDAPGVDILSIVKTMDIPSEFSEDALIEADKVFKPVSKADIKGRLDLRDIPMVTIDGAESKDLDDAVSVGVIDGDYMLGVHIADVSEYVKEDSPLDKDAKERCTSVYLCDRVIPMLPKKLSNGICSLNEGEDRLALSCLMRIDKDGNVKDHLICETVVNIDHRMTYKDVTAILKGDEKTRIRYKDFIVFFEKMAELSQIIRKSRKKKGCIDFDFPEAKILLNPEGQVEKIEERERDIASLMIEDFMILANVTVAREYAEENLPFLYRVHGDPDPEKLEYIAGITARCGVTFKVKKGKIEPKDIQTVLGKVKGKAEEPVINQFVLRAMQRAAYTTECEGHFGLAEKYYCHFTSPIRRYPDLQIHRIIKENLRGKLSKKRIEHYNSILPDIAKTCSSYERRAEEAERETDKMKKAEYMAGHKGETYDGVISGLTAFGMYVTLPNTIEGLVHISTMRDDYYTYVEETMELIGERTRRVYKIGQSVKIVVDNADKETRLIDFILAEK